MIENHQQLAEAATKFALENLDEENEQKLGKLRHEAFEKLGIEAKHFISFETTAAVIRNQHLGLRKHKLEDGQPK